MDENTIDWMNRFPDLFTIFAAISPKAKMQKAEMGGQGGFRGVLLRYLFESLQFPWDGHFAEMVYA